jgi:hypothetical protein
MPVGERTSLQFGVGNLGIVGDEYQPLQNWEAFAFFDSVLGPRMARYETAGVIDGRRRIWLPASRGGTVALAPKDEIQPYLLRWPG